MNRRETFGSLRLSPRTVGSIVEDAACRYLASVGYAVLERNYTCRLGEIDIVAKDGDVLVFVEVRFRGMGSVESPEESLDRRKLARMKRAARHYVAKRLGREPAGVRVDVCLARPVSRASIGKSPALPSRAETVQVPVLGLVSVEILRDVVDFV
ncbi:MAG TPA: YraN family protein [Firmicutes bacterium]|nr:YraN family protein [Candidatus Fermentithermobacillaceae bacterium]